MADNFQDNISYGGSTLAVSGDAIAVGSTNNGPKSVIFNNSGSQGHLIWQPTANQTITLPNSNGVVQLTGQVPGGIAAGGQTVTSGTVIFSNSNGMSFGLNGSTVTASHNGITSQTNQTLGRYAIGNTTGQSSSSTFDARTLSISGAGIASVGYSGNALIISVPSGGGGGSVNISAGTTSNNLTALTFSNSNGMSFGLNGSTITASFNGTLNSVGFSNSNNIIFGSAGNTTITASAFFNISGGTTSNNLSNFTLSNSNGISFGLNASTITASHNGITSQTNQTVGLYGLGNTTQNSSTTLDARSLSFNGLGIITAGYSNGSIQLSATQSAQTIGYYAVSNTTQNSSTTLDARTVSFQGAGGVSVGYSNGSVVISGGGGSINFSAGTTSGNINSVVFSNSNGISFGLNGSTITGNVAAVAGSDVVFSNSNNVTIGKNVSTVTISAPLSISAGTTNGNFTNVVFSNSNGLSFGLNGSTVTASYNSLIYSFEPYPSQSTASLTVHNSNTSGAAYFFPFIVDTPVAAQWMNLAQSVSMISVTGSGQQSLTMSYGLYSRGTGTNSSTISVMTSVSFGLSATFNGVTGSVAYPATTNSTGYATASTSSNSSSSISQMFGSARMIQLPINTTLSAGVYWLGIFHRQSTSSSSCGFNAAYMGPVIPTAFASIVPYGFSTSAFTTGTNAIGSQGGNWELAIGSFTSAAQTNLPNTIALSQLTNNLSIKPAMKFYSSI